MRMDDFPELTPEELEKLPGIKHYMERWAPFRELLTMIALPPRGVRGSRQNQRRARMLQAALHQYKVAGEGRCEIRRRRGHCSLCKVAVTYDKVGGSS